MAQPIWITPAGSLGTIPEGVFFSIPLQAYDPDLVDTIFYELIAGNLPPGIQLVPETGIMSGVPQAQAIVDGIPFPVSSDVTSKFAVRAYTKTIYGTVKRLADRTFTITVAGQNAPEFITPAGSIGTYFDGAQITDLQIQYTDTDPADTVTVALVGGSLPPGLSISTSGLISGYIIPDTNIPTTTTTNYEFIIELSDTKATNLQTFSILVYSTQRMTADNTQITADTSIVTADRSNVLPPIITTPQGNIGTYRNDNFFAFQFQGVDLNGDSFSFVADPTTPVPGLALDSTTGWLFGYIPNLGISELSYNFTVQVYKTSNPTIISQQYFYSINITGNVSTTVTWLTDSDLGIINNGDTSTFYVEATNSSGIPLQYRLESGSNSSLPQGLQLLPSGDIAGRVSFDTFALDGGTTTFDVTPVAGVSTPTTFDMKHTFTVNAYSVNGVVSVYKTFSITVIRKYNKPFDNLYIQAMPPLNDRALLSSLLQNNDIFPQSLLYRPDDPNFGLATKVVYYHAYGLAPETLDAYVNALNLNHYWKNLVLGSIETAQAVDSLGNVIYEVVYSRIVDNLVNNDGESVSKEVTLPYPILGPDSTETTTVYPNSLVDMRTQVIDSVGQISNVLPLWMTSKQANGTVLGFLPAWIIAYTKPGKSGQIAYNIKSQFGDQLNLIDFDVDRYELDNLLTKNWDRETQQWDPTPPTLTTFDITGTISSWVNGIGKVLPWVNNNYFQNQPNFISEWTTATPPGTIFDGGSLQFIDPVDMYSNTQVYDKYLLFPKHNILE